VGSSTNPLPQTLTAASTGTDFQFTASASTATGGAWLTVNNASFNNCSLCFTPQEFQAVVNAPPTMPAGSYAGQILFTSRDGSLTLTVPVTLTVADTSAGAVFDNLPGLVSFSMPTGGVAPPAQPVQIRNAGTGTLNWTLAASTSDGGNWLNVSAPSGTAPSQVNISINKTNLPGQGLLSGTFAGELVFRSLDETITVPVSVVVTANAFRQVNAINFTKPVNGANPLSQILKIASTGTDFQFTFGATTATGGNWLSVTNASFNGCTLCSTPLNLSANVIAGVTMPVGTYTGQIVITARDGTQTLTVPVTLTVADPAAGPLFDNLPGQMTFSLKTGGATPPAQAIQIRNAGAGTLNWTLETSTSDSGNWLNVSAVNGAAPSFVNVTINKTNLPGQSLLPGTFVGELVFHNGSQSITVPVSVVVGDAVFEQVNALSFVKPIGAGANPLPQTLTFASTGADFQFTFSASTANGGSWLTAENVSFNGCTLCSTPFTLRARVNAVATMAAGTYTGQIVVTARDGTQTMTVPVTLTVADPAASPFFDNIPGQMSFSLTAGSGSPANRSIQIRNAGTGTLNWTVSGSTSDGASWLTAAPASGAGTGTVTVGIAAASLPGQALVPGIFTGQLVFQSAASNVTVPVSVHVEPTVFIQNPTLVFATPNSSTNPPSQPLAISSSSATSIQFGVTSATGAGGNWLSVSTPAGCTLCATPASLSVSINATGLAVGTYTGQIVITARDSTEAMTVPVILTVGTPTPLITSVTPGTGQQGQTLASVAIVGQNTNFVQGTTIANFGAGITVNSLTVNSATSATANITIQNGATLGARTVTLTTGAEVAALNNGFTVTSGTATLLSVTPNTGQQGQNIATVAIVGQNTNFVQGTTVANFGAGITVNSLTVNSATSATANITVQNGATPGARTVTLTTGTEVASLPTGFTVTSGTATLLSVSPNSGQQGQNIATVAIVGQNTNFVQGTTVATFGAGITVNSLTVNSATTATANITIQNGATLGARTVTLTTGAEIVALNNGFTVTSGTATLLSVTPNSGQQGQNIATVVIVGQNTNFVQGTTVANFGAGITVNSLTVNSATTATANITIQGSAAAGLRNITMTTTTEVATLNNGFTVNPSAAPLDVLSFSVLFGSQSYNVAATTNTRTRLPWQVTGIQVVFNRPVTNGNVNSLAGLAATGLTGLGTNTLTWIINPVTSGNFLASLSGNGSNALSDASGTPLLGGAGYNRNFSVLFGDFNDDGVVSAGDLAGVNNATATAYNPFADMNGDGIVNVSDVQLVRTRIGTSLP
jgi:hypothetical protein